MLDSHMALESSPLQSTRNVARDLFLGFSAIFFYMLHFTIDIKAASNPSCELNTKQEWPEPPTFTR